MKTFPMFLQMAVVRRRYPWVGEKNRPETASDSENRGQRRDMGTTRLNAELFVPCPQSGARGASFRHHHTRKLFRTALMHFIATLSRCGQWTARAGQRSGRPSTSSINPALRCNHPCRSLTVIRVLWPSVLRNTARAGASNQDQNSKKIWSPGVGDLPPCRPVADQSICAPWSTPHGAICGGWVLRSAALMFTPAVLNARQPS